MVRARMQKAVIITLYPSPLLWREGDEETVISAPTYVRNGKQLATKTKLLQAESARTYLAEFMGFSETNGAPLWKPILRLSLSYTDKIEVPDAPGADVVLEWLDGSIDAVDLDAFAACRRPKIT